MVRFAHLLILSALMVWIVGSGCVGNDAAEVEESGIDSDAGAQDAGDLELNEAEILELEADMAELEALLENASLEEDIVIEEL